MQRYLTLMASAAQLVVSSGNHDLTGPDAEGEQSALWLRDGQGLGIKTDGDSALLDDTLITICPWWDGPLGRVGAVAQLEADAARRPPTWVWLGITGHRSARQRAGPAASTTATPTCASGSKHSSLTSS